MANKRWFFTHKPLFHCASIGQSTVPLQPRDALGGYDLVISTLPPIQNGRLFDTNLPQDAKRRQSSLEWIAVNSIKPDRNNDLTSLVVNSSNL